MTVADAPLNGVDFSQSAGFLRRSDRRCGGRLSVSDFGLLSDCKQDSTCLTHSKSMPEQETDKILDTTKLEIEEWSKWYNRPYEQTHLGTTLTAGCKGLGHYIVGIADLCSIHISTRPGS